MAEPDDEGRDVVPSRLARLYTLTGGRTRPTNTQLDVATMVIAGWADRHDADRDDLEPEQRRILALCQRPISVAEIAAHLQVPLTVAKIQLSDLIDQGAVVVGPPPPSPVRQDLDLLQAVLDGLHATL
jgi:hypothetical protein